jgi:hypothetical protein
MDAMREQMRRTITTTNAAVLLMGAALTIATKATMKRAKKRIERPRPLFILTHLHKTTNPLNKRAMHTKKDQETFNEQATPTIGLIVAN